MTHVGLAAPLDGIEGDADARRARRATALEDGVRELADSIRTSLNFYRTQESRRDASSWASSPAPRSRSPASWSGWASELRLPLEARVVDVAERAATRAA